MTAINCAGCGTAVNAEAGGCPECGADPRTGEGATRVTVSNESGSSSRVKAGNQVGTRKEQESVSSRWACPNCASVFVKNPALEALGEAYGVIGFSSKPLTCPSCSSRLDFTALLAGDYDVSD